MEHKEILNQPISRLGLSGEFMRASAAMNFQTIADILAIEPMDLVNKEGFSYTWLGELSEFLQKRQLLHLLQPIAGRNHD